jgi:FkbM family methyltransferase
MKLSTRAVLQYLLPFGLVRAWQLGSRLRELGLPGRRARRLSVDPDTPRLLSRAGLDLLPPGSLCDGMRIVDAGANRGDWTADLLRLCRPEAIACVEPHPDLAAGLRRRFASERVVTILENALGASAAQAQLQVAPNPLLHSLRIPHRDMAARFPEDFRVAASVSVAVRPLDDLVHDWPYVSLLKVDIQGGEREALAGASRTLRKCAAVMIEVNFVPHYEGEAGFAEVDEILRSGGLTLANYSVPRGRHAHEVLYADFVYARARA